VEAAFASGDLDESVAGLVERMRAWTYSTLNDDVALLAVELPRSGGRLRRGQKG
jgi:hypothetical protein